MRVARKKRFSRAKRIDKERKKQEVELNAFLCIYLSIMLLTNVSPKCELHAILILGEDLEDK